MSDKNEKQFLIDLMEKQHTLLGRVVESLDNIDRRMRLIEEKNA